MPYDSLTNTVWLANTKHHLQTDALKRIYQTNTLHFSNKSCFRDKFSIGFTSTTLFFTSTTLFLQVQNFFFSIHGILLPKVTWLMWPGGRLSRAWNSPCQSDDSGVSSDPAIWYRTSFNNERPTGEFVVFSGEKAKVNSTKLLFHEYE